MAKGDIGFVGGEMGTVVDILNRAPFEAIPMTIDFSGVSGDVVKGGYFITSAGAPAGVPTNAVGILLSDVHKDYPQGAVVVKGYINSTRAQANSGLTYTPANVKTALPMIVLE